MSPTLPFPRRPVPPLARVVQAYSRDELPDPRREVRERLLGAGLAARLRPGGRVAITAGSRGIGGFIELLAGIADAVRSAGATPFVIPAMGSHGGATAPGQREILRLLGVTEESVGAEIAATMDTVPLGQTRCGAVAHLDAHAAAADGIIVLGRVKTHPENSGPLASGLLKMSTIGLGKQHGAQQAHNHGLWQAVREVPELQLARGPILYGVAVVENAYRRPVAVEVVPAEYGAFLDADLRLLRLAKQHLGQLPTKDLDLLIVDELGKTVSGAGMDPNVIGRARLGTGGKDPVRRIVVLSLTAPSLGNGLGVGLADFTTRRFADAYDPAVTYVNLLTATGPDGTTREGPLPLALPSDQEAIEVALYSALAGERPRICRIKNTAELAELWVSEALLDEISRNDKLRVIESARPLPFDGQGNLL